MELVKIKRKCKPGETDINGISYDIESYRKEVDNLIHNYIDSDYYLGAELFFCEGDDYLSILKRSGFNLINPLNCCGKIVEISDDYILVNPLNEKTHRLLTKYESEALMRYIGNINEMSSCARILKIITFDIVIKADTSVKCLADFLYAHEMTEETSNE